MSVARDALLALVDGFIDLPPTADTLAELWANPLLCTPAAYEQAAAEATPVELATLESWRADGYLIVNDDLKGTRKALRAAVVPVNRAERRRKLRAKP